MKDESQENLSRVLDEIAEVTRNNNVMNATETNSPSNFKMFVHEPVAISIKSENDRYLLESADDEDLFDCQVELTEETESFVETENAKPLDESDQSLGEEQSAEMPKIHLKTVDEINRKCIVTSYIDTAKRRRQEVNRRYYLKRKQQQMLEKKVEDQVESKEVEKVEKLEVPVYHHLQEESVEITEPDVGTQDYNYPQYTEQTYPVEYPQEFCTGWTQESYENHTKKIRREINRRYYLKRKKKRQEEEGIEERVIVKNEAYFRRRERNRRYYLKKKQREKGDDQGDDSSNSSFQFNYSLSEDRTEMFGSQFGHKFQGMSEHSDYTCTSNEMTQEIKSESSSSANNYEGVNKQAVQGWVDSQSTYNQDYETEERSYEQLPHFITCNSGTTKQSLEEYLNEAARKRQERNRRYYLKHKEKLKQQRLQKGKNDLVTAQTEVT